jgi:hypothetical protein
MGDYRQSRNCIARRGGRCTPRSRGAAATRRKAIHRVRWPLNFVAAALSRAFRDRAGIFVFFAAASVVSAAKFPVVVFVPWHAQTISRSPPGTSKPAKLIAQ